MENKSRKLSCPPSWFSIFAVWSLFFQAAVGLGTKGHESFEPVVTKECRKLVASTESGEIWAVDVRDGRRGNYHLQFITMEPSSLLLPVLLHAEMVFYVHSGRATVTWTTGDGTDSVDLEPGDIYRLEQGVVFYLQSHADPTREKLRIYAIFNTVSSDNPPEAFVGAYSHLSDLVRGFDDRVLQMGFMVSEEVIRELKRAEKPPPIVHFETKQKKPKKNDGLTWEERVLLELTGSRSKLDINKKKKKKKSRTFNILSAKADVENCNGRSIAVNGKDFQGLQGSGIGVFMVNLAKGSIVVPHWNRRAMEIAAVTHGKGIVEVVCPSKLSREEAYGCENMKFKVKEWDVFLVQRFHPMAQISFNNDSFVFVGFSTSEQNNSPQFLGGKSSVFQVIDTEILMLSFNVGNATVQELVARQDDQVMLDCTSCAEEVERKIEEEMERKRQEEERKREEEEEKRREEEKARKRKEEEEARKRAEEEAKRKEEARKREEEEEAKRREEKEGAKRREEEEAREREEEVRRKEEEEAKRRKEEERRIEEEEEAQRREEEEARRREEKTRREEEAAKRWEEDEEARRRQEEGRRREEEIRRREEEEQQEEGEEEEAASSWEEEQQEKERKEGGEAPQEIRGGEKLLWKMWQV